MPATTRCRAGVRRASVVVRRAPAVVHRAPAVVRVAVSTCLLVSIAGPAVRHARAEDQLDVEDLTLHFSHARLTTVDGERFEARDIILQGNRLRLQGKLEKRSSSGVGYRDVYKLPDGVEEEQMPLTEVARIEIKGDTNAALGAGVGTIAGAALGLILIASTAADEDLNSGGVILVTVLSGSIGAAVGAGIGSFFQNWDTVYAAHDDAPAP
jgi:hypothetical protein